MTSYSCYIVDDEPLAIKVIVNFLSKLPNFHIENTFTDPFEAFRAQKSKPVDLIFLDIEMPDFNGLDFIRSIAKKPQIIITTAYRGFAVEGFDLNVLDYLVKPIDFNRFMVAIDRFIEQETRGFPRNQFLTVRADRKFVKISLDEILYIEGVKDYIKIATEKGNSILTKRTISGLYEELPSRHFLRVHKSFIVALDRITAFTHHHLEIGRFEIPVGRLYKDSFLERLGSK